MARTIETKAITVHVPLPLADSLPMVFRLVKATLQPVVTKIQGIEV